MGNNRGRTADQKMEIAGYYQAPHGISETGRQFGLAYGTVRKVLAGMGILREQGRFKAWSEADQLHIAQRWQEGQTQTQIAKAFGTSQGTIRRILLGRGMVAEERRPKGVGHGWWKGGRVEAGGYVRILTTDPTLASMADGYGYILEHRLVMARFLGRPLERHETIHHINGDGMDNRLENLQLRNGRHGKGSAYQCLDCGSHNVQAVAIAD